MGLRHGAMIAAMLLPLGGTGAQAQLTPQARTITLVVPFAAGGGVDVIGRLVAEKLQDRLKQPVVVENRVGAGGAIGMDSVAKATPDGHTLLLMDIASVLLKWLHKSVAFDVTQDFAPIAQVATSPLLLFAHPSVAANDVKGLIAEAKGHPGKFSAGVPGVGTPHHLAAAMLNAAAGVEITTVPYRGTGPALNDLVGGQIPLAWATPIALVPMVAAGKAKALGAASLQRVAQFPNAPTIAENAVPGFNVDIWFGLSAPAKTPPDIVARLEREVRGALAQPDVQQRMMTLGYAVRSTGSAEFGRFITSEYERYGKAIREAGIVVP